MTYFSKKQEICYDIIALFFVICFKFCYKEANLGGYEIFQ